ncbi:lytic transglycosylase domain-containing protein [Algoriphagus sanaruensis]|uniref:Murein transglycosylase n=1 Tax=Algoriphagus sanaruensis TaxID=1727163 RepID=A0A142EJW9_9BACT|nr:lytic transglycosylase domain-containing protein [Algoriphagus sanaruensis]AMQ55424.1 murein transglycosylase [Algoriphagus sanaruensis]
MSRIHLILIYTLVVAAFSLAGLAFWNTNSEENIEQDFVEVQPIVSYSSFSRDSIRLFSLPTSVDFAGEMVPLDQPDVMERLEREIYVNAYWESNMILLMKRSGKYFDEIDRIFTEAGVPTDFKYLALAESGLMNVVSPAGARGFWQFMESTAKEYGLEVNKEVDERYHFEKSTRAAVRYLQKAHAKFGDWTAVAASYNMGQTGFSKRQSEQFEKNYYNLYLNEETSRYLFRILAFKIIFENQGEFGFHLKEKDFYKNPEFKKIKVDRDIKDLAAWAKGEGSTYKQLKLYNPWLRDKRLNVRRGKVYEVVLPKE